jgi:hypothetical protein
MTPHLPTPETPSVLKPDIPTEQIQAIQPTLEPLLVRVRSQAEKLPRQADSALEFFPASEAAE